MIVVQMTKKESARRLESLALETPRSASQSEQNASSSCSGSGDLFRPLGRCSIEVCGWTCLANIPTSATEYGIVESQPVPGTTAYGSLLVRCRFGRFIVWRLTELPGSFGNALREAASWHL